MTEDPLRQLTPSAVDEYFDAGVPTSHTVSREPRCELYIDPRAGTFELCTPLDGAAPDLRGMQRVSVDTFFDDGEEWFRLSIEAHDIRYEAYGLLVSVVEAMRSGARFAAATAGALANLRAILSARRRISPEQQVGLIGELSVVRDLLGLHAETDVVDWWIGPLSEQHDFALPDLDLEVKTTTSERRTHVIHGTGQLRPNPARALWLISIQLTRAGGADGISLADLVADIRESLGVSRERFLEHLVGLGWRDSDADLYRDRYLFRSAPQAYHVDDDFPAITDERLAASVPHTDLVTDVSYRIDVSDRQHGTTGSPIDHFLHTGGDHD